MNIDREQLLRKAGSWIGHEDREQTVASFIGSPQEGEILYIGYGDNVSDSLKLIHKVDGEERVNTFVEPDGLKKEAKRVLQDLLTVHHWF